MTRTRESMTLSPNDSNSDSDDLRNPVATGEAVTPLELCDWRCVAWRVTDWEISTSRPVLLEGIWPAMISSSSSPPLSTVVIAGTPGAGADASGVLGRNLWLAPAADDGLHAFSIINTAYVNLLFDGMSY